MSKYGKSATGFKLSALQKTVGQPKFHRPPQRFPPARKAQSGVDPLGNFVSFMKSDPVPNIDIHKQIRKKTEKTDFTHLNDKWAVGTTKFRSNTSDLHKRATLNAGINMISTKQPFRNPTDIISFNPPQAKKPFQKVYDKMRTDPGYKNNIQSKLGWADKMQTNETATLSMNNRSSVPHNIITHVDNTTSPVIEMGLLDHKVTNRKKGITEYADLSRVTALRNNEGHGEAYGGNINIFKRKTGIFTHMYDAAARHGNLNMPFGD